MMGRKRKHIILGLLLCLFALQTMAQDFSIERFRPLPNDLTGFRIQVKDLNGDACALLKVVGGSEYDFTTPLGIVKRIDEVGEVWLYIPHGSLQITIRHPEWGVLRDYAFEEALKGNLTYEMVISSPKVRKPTVEPVENARTYQDPLPLTLHEEPTPEITEEPEHLVPNKKHQRHYLLMIQGGIGTETFTYGVRAGILQKFGGYLLFQTDMKSTPGTIGTCEGDGKVKGTGNSYPFYSGEVKHSNWMVTGGGIQHIVSGLHIYEGVGYGSYVVVWGTSSGNYYKNEHDSAIGLSAEAGALYRLGKVTFSVGTSTIMGKHWEANVGIGISF